jgi:hypothetical protein
MRGIDLASLFAALSVTAIGCDVRLREGRAGPLRIGLDRPVLFDTPQADVILAGMAVFPPTNPWNEEILDRPVRPDSSAIIASIGAETPLAWNLDMNFVLIPSAQRRVEVDVSAYADQSDPGPFPIPDNAPIESWPVEGDSLASIQREGDGDRHLIVVDPGRGQLFELLEARLTDQGWEAAQSSVFDLSTNAMRPEEWTSADAAGLPIFPAIVRYDEVASGMVRHALRFTAPSTRNAYVYPARHFASSNDDPALPRMGERLRLKRDFDATTFPPHARAVLEGLKIYGMMLADNGLPWRISVAPDSRIQGLEALSRVRGSDFEVVETTGPNEGPRLQ